MNEDSLEILKRRLNITDELQDEVLKDLLEMAENHFCTLIKQDEVPRHYEFIIIDVASARYTRMGSDGVEKEVVDGYSVEYITDDFKPYLGLLERDFNISGSDAGVQLL